MSAVQIQANSGLSQRDIDRMLKEAELQKERDQQIKELAEIKNEAETLIRSAEVDHCLSLPPSPMCVIMLTSVSLPQQ
jgi:molecular chaperone DnaK (HSP70)